MILSRVWYLLLAIAATMGFAFALVSVRLIDARSEEAVRDGLRRDRFELEATLKLDARSRIDALAPLAAQGDVRTALREATQRRTEDIDGTIVQRLTTRLGELNRQLGGMAGDLVFAVDGNGIIVAQLGGASPPRGAGLAGFPLVRRALDGYVRDDVWAFPDGVYRMAARPVIDGGQYVGAIVLGKRVDAAFAQLLSSRLHGASLAFFHREQVFASAMADSALLPPGTSAPRQDDMAAPLAEVLASPEFRSGERFDPRELPTGGLAIYAPVVGAAGAAQVGYAIARPVPTVGSFTAIFSLPSSQDWSDFVQSTPGMTVIGTGVLAFLLGLFFVWLERDRPLARFRAATEALAKRDADKLIPTQFGGPLRTAAVHINDAIEKIQETAGAAPKRRAANLDEILGPADQVPSTPAFFGFAGNPNGDAADIPPAPPPSPAAAAPEAPKAPPAPPKAPVPAAKPPPPAPPKVQTPEPLAATAEPAAAPPAPPAAAASAEAPSPPATPRPAGRGPLAGTLLGVGPAAAAAALRAEDNGDDGATMVARVSDELLAKAATGADPETLQEAHYREVFEQFLKTKTECGEPTTGLTFDKFVVTLRKNREQIVQRHGASQVRFTVYVKEGKAALKATPLRE